MKLNVDEFFKIWKGEYKNVMRYSEFYTTSILYETVVKFVNCEIDGNINLESIDNLPALQLFSCKINGFSIKNCKNQSLEFNRGCEIDHIICDKSNIGNIIFDHCQVRFFKIEEGSQIGNLSANNVNVQAFIEIDTDSNVDNIVIENSLIEGIFINSKSRVGKLIITSESQVKKVVFNHSTGKLIEVTKATINNLGVTNSTIGRVSGKIQSEIKLVTIGISSIQDIFFDNESKCELISVENFSLIGSIAIYHKSISKSIRISGESEVGPIYIKTDAYVEFLNINNKSKTGLIHAYKSTVGNVAIYEDSKIFAIILEYLSSESKQIIIKNSTVEKLLFALDKPFQIVVSDYSTIHELTLRNIFAKQVFFQASDTQINEIILDSFINEGVITFNNIIPITRFERFLRNEPYPAVNSEGKYGFEMFSRESKFFIVNSDLGEIQFIGCKLHMFKKFVFLNSKILEAFIADTWLPENYQIGTIDKKDKDSYLFTHEIEKLVKGDKKNKDFKEKQLHLIYQQRLVMSQFKKVFENMGDNVRAIQYHAYELEAYRQYLKTASKKGWFIGEYINLSLNRYSSYYGNNWIRAVLMTFVLNSIFFAVYCLSLGYGPGNDFGIFWQLVSYSPEFLNPLRKADFLKDLHDTTPLGRLVDYTSRIFMAYFVYQTIQAFRKFGKKST